MYDMELWEFNSCVKAYNEKQREESKAAFVRVWQTANLTGAAFGGKLKKLEHYLREPAKKGQEVSLERQAEIDRILTERGRKDVP